MKRAALLAALVSCAAVASAQNVAVSGQITTWEKTSQMASPKEKPLADATVLVGQNLNLEVASTDVVRGKVLGEAKTDGSGNFRILVPKGSYNIIVWKAGYVPQTGAVTAPTVSYKASISKDTGVGASGRHNSLRK